MRSGGVGRSARDHRLRRCRQGEKALRCATDWRVIRSAATKLMRSPMDATDKGHTGLGDYYAQKGESPGVWMGSSLAVPVRCRVCGGWPVQQWSRDELAAQCDQVIGDESRCVSMPFVRCCLITESGTVAVARYRPMLGKRAHTIRVSGPHQSEFDLLALPAPVQDGPSNCSAWQFHSGSSSQHRRPLHPQNPRSTTVLSWTRSRNFGLA